MTPAPSATIAAGATDAQPSSPAASSPATASTVLTGTPPKSSKTGDSGGTKAASHRAAASDDAASASQLTALAIGLLAPSVPASPIGTLVSGAQDSNEQDSDASDNSGSADSVLGSACALSNAWYSEAANAATPKLTQATTASFAPATSDPASAANAASTADLSALASLVRGLPGGAVQAGTAQHSIAVPVSDPSWPHAVAAQVQLFAAANIQSATLRLSPEHLGPVEVHIDMQASQINVSFVAAHAETRSALEQSVPTLRAMLAHGGLTLGQAQVQGEARSGSQSLSARTHGVAGAESTEEPIAASVTRSVGLIDEYA